MQAPQPQAGATRGRFAPTPSGRLHLGNLACSLLAWLSAHSKGGAVILRIEDLDVARCSQTDAALAEADFAFLGLSYTEGGKMGGSHEPYTQSKCGDIYTKSYEKLAKMGLLYPCFCSRKELHNLNAPHAADGTFVYGGACRGLSAAQIAEKGRVKSPAMRLCVPDETITFTDGNLGIYSENLARDCGDFVVRRGDGIYPYQLAVVVDDARMGITEIVRGADLLPSAARQIYLYRLLGLPIPQFYHCPLLLAPDGRRLSKRDGDDSLAHLAAKYSAEEIIGKLAFVYGLQDAPTPRTAQSLVADFDWAKVPTQDICLPEGLF
ncbi:MAG: tRNA glutamyl-Q(34) synthetase GluQRS [Faecalibacterium sp.]